MPFRGTPDPKSESFLIGWAETLQGTFQIGKAIGRLAEARKELLVQKHGDKWPELQLGGVAGDTLTIGLAWNDGIKLHEASKPLTGRSGADIQSLHDLIH